MNPLMLMLIQVAIMLAIRKLFEKKAPELEEKIIKTTTFAETKEVLVEEGMKLLLSESDEKINPILTDLTAAKSKSEVETVIAKPEHKKTIIDLILSPVGNLLDALFGKK